MKDVIVIVIVLGFFALAVGYVGWCERIIANGASEPLRAGPNGPERSPDRAVSASDDISTVTSGAR